jgi:hypothetical protein
MNIPPPVSFGPSPTIALAPPAGWLGAAILQLAGERAPIVQHRLGPVSERQHIGPRELRDQTLAALEKLGATSPWGFGCICDDAEAAGYFATAGATWFSFDLVAKIEPQAESMSLDALDAAIVALEDAGCFTLGWFEAYFLPERGYHGAPGFAFSEEGLARAAVKFGAALDFAEQLFQVARAAGGGGLPDVEYRFDGPGAATTKEELIFLCAELGRRGLLSGAGTRLRPAFGPWYEAGGEDADFSPPAALLAFPELCPPGVILSAPLRLARAMGWARAHWDATEESRLAFSAQLARTNPATFRQWLTAAHLAFPVARAGKHFSTTEDDLRALPDVADDQLVATFLETRQGRQLLLATWEDVEPAIKIGE